MLHSPLETFLEPYRCQSRAEYERALKEIIQELALVALWRSKFFEHAAFYGGTALRILYALDRFSEDLDFTLKAPNPDFALSAYNQAIQSELASFGLDVEVDTKDKSWETDVRSAFIKTKTLGELIKIGIPKGLIKGLHPDALIKIKLEVDTNPAPAYDFEAKFLSRPFAIGIETVTLRDIFAGKMHAVLFREWRGRVKGRDWYDWSWLVRKGLSLSLERLAIHMKREDLTPESFRQMMHDKIDALDVEDAKRDMQPFAADPAQIACWSKEYFRFLLTETKLV